MRPKICVTVTGRTMADLRRRRDQVTNADLVELRLDSVEDPDASAALAGRRLPVVFTCRPAWEGGRFAGSEEERHRLLQQAQQLGAEYVDLEWKAGFQDLLDARGGRGVVLSMHDHTGVPNDLHDTVRAMRGTHAEVVKVAVTANRLSDCLSLLPVASDATTPSVLIAMGPAGLATRVLASRFNSCWTYAGDAVAPGQISVERLRDGFSFDRISGRTALYGVVGRPIMHSLSPVMHNAAFTAAGIDAVYVPFAAADFDDFLAFADAMRVEGVSVTAPFKRPAFDRAAARDELSERTRAANTLRRRGVDWDACNTDVAGFLAPLRQASIDVTGKRATILGAGGAARAAAAALQSAGAHVTISARKARCAVDAAEMVHCGVVDWPPPPGSWDVLVNATPVGTAPAIDDTLLPEGPFTGDLVYDLVYNPPETRLLRDARGAGCRTIGGLEMLVAQARLQFEWWTNRSVDECVMRNAARRALQSDLSAWSPVTKVHEEHQQ